MWIVLDLKHESRTLGESECSVGTPLQTQATTIRPEGTSGPRETWCSKAEAQKHRLGYFILGRVCVIRVLKYWQTVASSLYHPSSTHLDVPRFSVYCFGSHSQCRCGGPLSGCKQRCQCPQTWRCGKTEGRWVGPWWFGWPLACKATASLTAGRRYSPRHQ